MDRKKLELRRSEDIYRSSRGCSLPHLLGHFFAFFCLNNLVKFMTSWWISTDLLVLISSL
jgi:hypothetical protein